MNTKTEFPQRLDDLIFENRNRDYGAYVIRKSYSDNVNKAFLVALSVATLLAMLPFINSMFGGSRGVVVITKEAITPMKLKDIPRIIAEELPKQVTKVTQRIKESVVATHVVKGEVVQAENIDLKATSTVPDNGDMTSDVSLMNEQIGAAGDGETSTTVTTTAPPLVMGIMAEYVGGPQAMAKFILNNLKYPSRARSNMIQGTVYVSFVVDTEGHVIRTEILRGISRECDEEAKRVVSLMPGWKPAHQNGMAVMVKMVLPIKFALGED